MAAERKEEEASAARARAAQNPDSIAEQSGEDAEVAEDVADADGDDNMVDINAEEHPGASTEMRGADSDGSNPTEAMHAEDGGEQPGDGVSEIDAEPARIQEVDGQPEGRHTDSVRSAVCSRG